MIGIGSKKGNHTGKNRSKERVRTRKGFGVEEIAEETVEELEEANKDEDYDDEFEADDEEVQDETAEDEEGSSSESDGLDGDGDSGTQFGSEGGSNRGDLFDDEAENESEKNSPTNHQDVLFDPKQTKDIPSVQEQNSSKNVDKRDTLKQMKSQKSMRENVPIIPDWMKRSNSKMLSDVVGEIKKLDDKSDVFFDDAEVDFNFVADFSKLLSIVRYLLHTVRKQSKIIKELESTIDHHATYMDRVIAISDIGPVTQADLSKALVLPDGRTMKEAVIIHEESITKTIENVSENTHKIIDLESQVSRKAERETVVNVLLYDKLANDYAESKHLLESLNTEFIQVKTIVSAPQARDEFCRQKVEDLQDTINRLEETTGNKLDKREYTHFLESMMKRQREIESNDRPDTSSRAGNRDSPELTSDMMMNPAAYGLTGTRLFETSFSSPVKNLTDAFVKTFNFWTGAANTFASDIQAFARGVTPSSKLPDRNALSTISEYAPIMKELEKINFLVNLKTYKHEVEDIVASQAISKPQLEIRLSAFFKQIRKVFQGDLVSLMQKYVGDIKINPIDLRSVSSDKHQEHHFHPPASTRGYTSRNPMAESFNIAGPTPRLGSEGKGQHYISPYSQSTLAPISHNRLKPDNKLSTITPSPRVQPGQQPPNAMSAANALPSSRGGQTRTLKPLTKIVQEQDEQSSNQPPSIKRVVSPRNRNSSFGHASGNGDSKDGSGHSAAAPEIRIN